MIYKQIYKLLCWFGVALVQLGCAAESTPVTRGAAVFADPGFSSSRFNQYACASCHRVGAEDRIGSVLPGGSLAGSTRRPDFWGGTIGTFSEAVALCYRKFMRGGTLDTSSASSLELYVFLDSLNQTAGASSLRVSFTIPQTVAVPAMGDAAKGARTWRLACANCHGDAAMGVTPPVTGASVLPADTEREHTAAMGYTMDSLRQVFVEKTRHGAFLGFAGVMPPFSTQTLSDQDLSDIVSYLNPTLR